MKFFQFFGLYIDNGRGRTSLENNARWIWKKRYSIVSYFVFLCRALQELCLLEKLACFFGKSHALNFFSFSFLARSRCWILCMHNTEYDIQFSSRFIHIASGSYLSWSWRAHCERKAGLAIHDNNSIAQSIENNLSLFTFCQFHHSSHFFFHFA